MHRRGYPLAKTAIRHYMIHTNASSEGLVVTQYPHDKVSQLAAHDYRNLADELDTAPAARSHTDLIGAR